MHIVARRITLGLLLLLLLVHIVAYANGSKVPKYSDIFTIWKETEVGKVHVSRYFGRRTLDGRYI